MESTGLDVNEIMYFNREVNSLTIDESERIGEVALGQPLFEIHNIPAAALGLGQPLFEVDNMPAAALALG